MPRRAYRLPRRIVFPFGYIVKIKLAKKREVNDEDGTPNDGWYNPEKRILYVYKGLSPGRRRYIIGHELTHAVQDWLHFCLTEGIMVP